MDDFWSDSWKLSLYLDLECFDFASGPGVAPSMKKSLLFMSCFDEWLCTVAQPLRFGAYPGV